MELLMLSKALHSRLIQLILKFRTHKIRRCDWYPLSMILKPSSYSLKFLASTEGAKFPEYFKYIFTVRNIFGSICFSDFHEQLQYSVETICNYQIFEIESLESVSRLKDIFYSFIFYFEGPKNYWLVPQQTRRIHCSCSYYHPFRSSKCH